MICRSTFCCNKVTLGGLLGWGGVGGLVTRKTKLWLEAWDFQQLHPILQGGTGAGFGWVMITPM